MSRSRVSSPALPVLTITFSNCSTSLKRPSRSMVYWKSDAGRRRRRADLAGRDLLRSAAAAPARRPVRSGCAPSACPDRARRACEYWPAPNMLTLPTPGRRAQLVLELDGGVVAEKEAVVAAVGRSQRRRSAGCGRLASDRDALRLHRVGQLRPARCATRFCTRTCAMFEVGADVERDRQRVACRRWRSCDYM